MDSSKNETHVDTKQKTLLKTPVTGAGSRVIRGDDWPSDESKDHDGGAGSLGTVKSHANDTVSVVWDTGNVVSYEYSSTRRPLRIYDSGGAGQKHKTITCDGCGQNPVFGIRWCCSMCHNYDLCSSCYHGDKHDIDHTFYRILTGPAVSKKFPCNCRLDEDVSEMSKYLCPARSSESRKLTIRGFYVSATVVRGTDWKWQDQDGGEGKEGNVIRVSNWADDQHQTSAKILWSTNGSSNNYRIGYEGMVDLKCVSPAPGCAIYESHLPLLGEKLQFELQDHVVIAVSSNALVEMQRGHGGASSDLDDVAGAVGRIVAIDKDNDVMVRFENGIRFLFNPLALRCALPEEIEKSHSENCSSSEEKEINNDHEKRTLYAVGDRVRLIRDMDRVKSVQMRVAWSNLLLKCANLLGTIEETDGLYDVTVRFSNGHRWKLDSAVIEDAAEPAPLKESSPQAPVEPTPSSEPAAPVSVEAAADKPALSTDTFFAVNDKARLSEDTELIERLQEDYGGWMNDFKKYAGMVGKVSKVHEYPGIVRLLFQDGQKIWLNPELLKKVDRSTKLSPIGSSGSVFSLGDAVKISSDLEDAKQKQKDHGGWVDGMAETLGKRGRVKRIFDDGDVRVKVGANSWTYNPELLSAADASDDTSASSGDESGSDSDARKLKMKLELFKKLLDVLP